MRTLSHTGGLILHRHGGFGRPLDLARFTFLHNGRTTTLLHVGGSLLTSALYFPVGHNFPQGDNFLGERTLSLYFYKESSWAPFSTRKSSWGCPTKVLTTHSSPKDCSFLGKLHPPANHLSVRPDKNFWCLGLTGIFKSVELPHSSHLVNPRRSTSPPW